MVSSFQKERRVAPRLRGSIPLKICEDGGDIVTETKDVSRSGAYCVVNRYIEPMTKMKIHLLLPSRNNEKNKSKKISCEGVIVRTEKASKSKKYNVAIFFSDISKRCINTLSDYVDEHLEVGV